MQEDPIPEDLIANIPVVKGGEETVFVPVAGEEEDVIIMPESTVQEPAQANAATPSSSIAETLRYEMGEAFARELDRAAQLVSTSVMDLEIQLARLHEQVAALQTENEELRTARQEADRKLNAFKELASSLGR